MNTRSVFRHLPVLGLGVAALAARAGASETPVPVTQAPPAIAAPRVYDYDQKLFATQRTLLSPEQARDVLARFKDAYARLGSPRLLLYVNRTLVADPAGLQLTHRNETSTTETKGDAVVSEQVTAQNTYEPKSPASATPALADRQTVRDIERLIGRPLRLAGATLADQPTAAALLADHPGARLTLAGGDQAVKDREALSKIADVVIEVLVSSRNVVVREVSGDQVVSAPDLQVTAIRLSDARILGQACATDVLGRDRNAGENLRQFDINDVTEATAFALMEDIVLGAPPAAAK